MKRRKPILRLFSTSQFIVAAVMLLLLPLLATLQYHWQGQLSVSERDQMKMHLRALATTFVQDFDHEITSIFLAFLPYPEAESKDRLSAYATSYDRWSKSSSFPGLVNTLFLALADEQARLHLHQLNRDTQSFERCEWPQAMTGLRHRLEEQTRNLRAFVPPQPTRTETPPHLAQPLNEELPGLVLPLLEHGRAKDDRGLTIPHVGGFIIVKLDPLYIRQEMLPALVNRHFVAGDGSSYDLKIVARRDQQRVIYQSTSMAISAQSSASNADHSADLFSLHTGELRDLLRARLRRGEIRVINKPNRRPGSVPMFLWTRGFLEGEQQALWQMHIRHRAGSLEAAVASVRRRNLVISFGILALLAASVALLIDSAHRARRLAKQQMDFVAGVSHELRTPLAVIESAAYNLDKGVVKAPLQVQNYGALIRKETGRLKEMVEQILEFAGVQSGRLQFNLHAVSINQILDDVLLSSQPLLAEGGFQIEIDIAPDMPPVLADQTALARAIQNLLNNAMKYSGENRWIGLRANVAQSPIGQSVQITVADRGIGIPAEELGQIFEPFYRGREASAAQIHGNGLGLSLIKNIIAAHQGTVNVKSTPGTGSSFIISLPAMTATQQNNNKLSAVTSDLSYE